MDIVSKFEQELEELDKKAKKPASPAEDLIRQGTAVPSKAEALPPPLLETRVIPDSQLKDLNKKHGTDWSLEDLRAAAAWHAGRVEEEDLASASTRLLGILAKSAGVGIPQKLTREQYGENEAKLLDDINQLASEKQSLALDVVSAAAPVAGAGKLLAGTGLAKQVGGAATVGAGAGYGMSKEGTELESAALGAGIGAALPAAAAGLSKVPEALQKFNLVTSYLKADPTVKDPLKAAGELIDRNIKASQYETNTIVDALSADKLELDTLAKFKRTFIGDIDKVAELASPTTVSEMERILQRKPTTIEIARAVLASARSEILDKAGKDASLKTLIDGDRLRPIYEGIQAVKATRDAAKELQTRSNYMPLNKADRFMFFISDVRPLFNMLDNTFGNLNAVKIVDDAGILQNKQQDVQTQLAQKFKKLFPEPAKLKNADIESLPQTREFLDYTRDLLNDTYKVKIQYKEDYFPRLKLSGKEAYKRMREVAEEVNPRAFAGRDLKNLEGLEEDFVNQLRSFTGADMRTGDDLAEVWNLFEKDPAAFLRASTESELRSSLGTFKKRKEEDDFIPEWMKETDPLKAIARYATNLNRGLATIPTTDKLFRLADQVDELTGGADFTGRWVRELAGDMISKRSDLDTFNIIQSIARKKAVDAELANKPIAAKIWSGIEAIPEVQKALTGQIYVNLLSNPGSAVKNFGSYYSMILPELGIIEATRLSAKNLMKLAAVSSKGKLHTLVEDRGYMPKGWDAESHAQFAQGLEKALEGNKALKMSKSAIDKYSSAMMTLFQLGERANRGMLTLMAEDASRKAFENSKFAHKILGNMTDLSYKKSLTEALENNNYLKFKKEYTAYAQAKLAQHYNRLTMSEMGKTLGPMFSMFSKWPTSQAGRVYQSTRRAHPLTSSREVVKQFLMPLGILLAADAALESQLGDRGQVRKDSLLGKKGLAGISAADSVIAIAGIGKNPVSQLGADVFKAADSIFQPSKDEVRRPLGEARPRKKGDKPLYEQKWFQTYVPGGGLVKAVTRDLPRIITGREDKPRKPLGE